MDRLQALENPMNDAAQSRVEILERLVSELRHDLRGAMSPAALIADRLRQNDDPAVQRSGKTIGIVVERVLAILEATCQVVPPRGPAQAGPVIGAGGVRR
jgi:hypothetical protein